MVYRTLTSGSRAAILALMIRLVAVVFGLCVCVPFVTARAQTPQRDLSNVLKQLLAIPTPKPLFDIKEPEFSKQRPDSFFAKDNPPPDDAPTEDLIDYWTLWAHSNDRLPSDAVKQRLVEALIDDPKKVATFIHFFPQSEAAATKVKETYDRALNDEQVGSHERTKIKEWLLYNSNFFLNELLALATKSKDDEKHGNITRENAVVALAKVNWEVAEPLLRTLMASTQPRSATLALSLFYRHAIEQNESGAVDRYRKTLQAISADRNQPAYARHLAIEHLTETEWTGRDDWYLGLFQDETLLDMTDGGAGLTPLEVLFGSDEKKWIPIMTRLMESKDINVRSAAATCLISTTDQNLRRDALLPLLPWLTNPGWLKVEDDRFKLIQALKFVDIPESVPGLIWSLENVSEPDTGYERNYAAASLTTYKDPRAVPALKKALVKEKDEYHRTAIIESLIACQGLSDAEQLEALQAYAAKLATPEGREQAQGYVSGETLPLPLSIGRYLSGLKTPPETLAQGVLNRADTLKPTNPALSQALMEIAHRWQGRQVDLNMINRIANGSADVKLIQDALTRREPLREPLRQRVRPELLALSAESGAAQGIAVALLEDPSLAQGVLSSDDQFAQIALLACSRLTWASLPVELVGPLLSSKNSLLSLAAKNYLMIEDSKEARELLWKHHPNQAFVTGWSESHDLGSPWGTSKLEDRLRAELFKENGPVEIIALIYWGDSGQVLRIYSDKAVYTYYEDSTRYRERVVLPAEVSALKDFLTLKNIADFGPQIQFCHHGCPSYQFFTVTKEKGRRVYTSKVYGDWAELQERFIQFGDKADAKIHYNLEKEIKGLELLFADKKLAVKDVWKQGDEIRMFVERSVTEQAKDQNETADSASDDEDDEDLAVRNERWRRRIAKNKAPFSWRLLKDNKASEVTSEPEIFSTIDESKFPPYDDEDSVIDYDVQVQKLTSDSILIARNTNGLWKQFAGSKSVRMGEGAYKDPVVTPDGKWVVVAKGDEDWFAPNYVVRVNLRTGREFRVNLEPADEFNPIAYVPSHGKVLLRRAKELSNKSSVGPDRVEYHLVDPATGETRLVSGEFEPLTQKGHRFLQPAAKPNEYWAAMPDADKNETQVGHYNLKDFTFKVLFTVPSITFYSMTMWVDERENKIYVVYKDQLLRLPLKSEPQKGTN